MGTLIILLGLMSFDSAQAELRTFESDLCTLFPNGKWAHCCFEHDLHYWAGGEKSRRDWADLELRSCVRATGKKKVAKWMYRGVRLGHVSPIQLKSRRWSNAFLGQRKRFQKHSYAEIMEIVWELQHYDIDPELKNKLLDSIEY